MSHSITKQVLERAQFAGNGSDLTRRMCENCDVLVNFSGTMHEASDDQGVPVRLEAFQIYCAKNCRRGNSSL